MVESDSKYPYYNIRFLVRVDSGSVSDSLILSPSIRLDLEEGACMESVVSGVQALAKVCKDIRTAYKESQAFPENTVSELERCANLISSYVEDGIEGLLKETIQGPLPSLNSHFQSSRDASSLSCAGSYCQEHWKT